jgi:hypothetical protein
MVSHGFGTFAGPGHPASYTSVTVQGRRGAPNPQIQTIVAVVVAQYRMLVSFTVAMKVLG